MMKRIRCGACGSKDISPQNIQGRKFSYKSYLFVELSEELSMNVCSNCGNEIFLSGDAEALDSALERSVQVRSSSFIQNILEDTGWKQKEMADYLGFTAVYISDVKNGKRTPEVKTYNYLRVLSECSGAIECVVSDDKRCDYGHEYLLVKDVRESESNLSEPSAQSYNYFPIAA